MAVRSNTLRVAVSEPANAALAQDHVVVSLREHVFRREQQLLDGPRPCRASEHGLLGRTRRLSNEEFCMLRAPIWMMSATSAT